MNYKYWVATNARTHEVLIEASTHTTVERWLKRHTYSKGLGTGYFLQGTDDKVIVDGIM